MWHASLIWHTSFLGVSHTSRWYGRHTEVIEMTYMWHAWFMCCKLFICTSHRSYWYVWDDSNVTQVIDVVYVVHMYVTQKSLICVRWVACDLSYWHVRYKAFICVRWLIHTCDMNALVWHDSLMCVVTHSYVWHVSFICVRWLILTCDMIHSYAWHDSFISVTCVIDMAYVISRCVTHKLLIRVRWLT